MFGVGHFWEILILLVIVLLVFGPGKLPEVGSALGRGIREFKDATSNLGSSSQPPANTYQQNYQQPVISQTPPAQAPRQVPPPQQWEAPAAPVEQPVTREGSAGDR